MALRGRVARGRSCKALSRYIKAGKWTAGLMA